MGQTEHGLLGMDAVSSYEYGFTQIRIHQYHFLAIIV